MPSKIKLQNFKKNKPAPQFVKMEFDFPSRNQQNLGNLSITIDLQDSSFSFFNNDNNAELLNNPAINLTKKEMLLTNKTLPLLDKSDEINNPIFEIDELRSKIYMKKTKSEDTKASTILRSVNINNTKTKYRSINASK